MSTPVALKENLVDAPRSHVVPDIVRIGQIAKAILRPLASLKLTVALFGLAIFIVFASTLAQKELDIWDVIHGWYRVDERNLITESFPWINPAELFVYIPFQIFLPDTFFPSAWHIPGGFYFPRGWVLGLFMAINLLAAHAVRFTVQARGARALWGCVVLALGCYATYAAVQSGASYDQIQRGAIDLPILAEFDPAATRILWQLIKGTGAGLVLLAGCILLFKKRAGVVLLHGGVGLMFLYEVIVGTSHDEAQMPIIQGTTSNWVHDLRSAEIAITEQAADRKDKMTVVPQSFIHEGAVIPLADQPFDLKVVKYYKNSRLRDVKDLPVGEKNPATLGLGRDVFVEPLKPVSGVDTGKSSDMTSAYVELIDKAGKSLGTFLVGLELWHFEFMTGMFPPQTIDVGGKTYVIAMRYKRTYKPYSITAVKVSKDDYVASDKPRNYSSLLHVVDKSRNVDREEKIWMNNPMRFAGETFYQSGYSVVDGQPMTTVSVVRNDGWMLPYVSCMIVAVGLLAQFGSALGRFLKRRTSINELHQAAEAVAAAGIKPKRSTKQAAQPVVEPVAVPSALNFWLPIAGVSLLAVLTVYTCRVPSPKDGELNLYEFGKLPVAYESRVKPFDSMARGMLSFLSHREMFKEKLSDESERSKPALRWLLDVITHSPKAETYQVFRIDNLDALKVLGLERNKFSRYSLEEIAPHLKELDKQRDQILKKKTAPEPFEREIMKLHGRLQAYRLVEFGFFDPGLEMPSEAEFRADPEGTKQKIGDLKMRIDRIRGLSEMLQSEKMQPPLAVPEGKDAWKTYTDENLALFMTSTFDKTKMNPAAAKLHSILEAYKKNDAKTFNKAVADYRDYLTETPPKEYDRERRDMESYLNQAAPFWYASWFYLLAFVVAACSWLVWTKPLNRAAFWMIVFTLGYHTLGLIVRMYVSGRPPVTNLYSSAVFIGWGAVVLGIALEATYRIGLGNIVASVAGFGSLMIAWLLTHEGDTIHSLEAVLDTQFWLTTHVVCVTLGYATTFVAGILGILYVFLGTATKTLTPALGKDLARMTYGTLCFALFFSFVGTVLGGLWADDSWGRFWGWDPKENGALIIVLWNALVLHARWDGMIKDRGLAVLAVAGNITTSWSWFGVNQLGVGLHAYGFSKELLEVLFWFVMSSVAVVAIGMLPRKLWMSNSATA